MGKKLHKTFLKVHIRRIKTISLFINAIKESPKYYNKHIYNNVYENESYC